ncbi:hypothetical protein [Winogradskyella sp. R77965]|uniref:hypothetical protein n=1 Tax=Winogradskyella sp. R77965 TaxID=3093872 RepID=UPI0037DD477B
MKRIILILILISTVSCQKKNECNYIENYYQKVYLAEEAYYKEDYQKVFEQMSEAEKSCEVLNQRGIYEMLKYAESSARIGKKDKALQLIRQLLLNGYEIDQLANNEAFQNLVGLKEWSQLEKDYQSLHNEYLNSIDLELREKIAEMKRIDQMFRQRGEYDQQKSDSIDAINEPELKRIIEKYGYPDERIIGGFKIDNQPVDPGILLFHFDDYGYWTKKLEELIEKGEAPPQSLGNFVDSYQRRVPEQKKYIYGIYDNVGEESIKEYEKLDERRVSIGLAPMQLKRSIDSLKRIYYGY